MIVFSIFKTFLDKFEREAERQTRKSNSQRKNNIETFVINFMINFRYLSKFHNSIFSTKFFILRVFVYYTSSFYKNKRKIYIITCGTNKFSLELNKR